MGTLSLCSNQTIFCFHEFNFLISSLNYLLEVSDTFLKELLLFKAHQLILFKIQNKSMAPISFLIVPEETPKFRKVSIFQIKISSSRKLNHLQEKKTNKTKILQTHKRTFYQKNPILKLTESWGVFLIKYF